MEIFLNNDPTRLGGPWARSLVDVPREGYDRYPSPESLADAAWTGIIEQRP